MLALGLVIADEMFDHCSSVHKSVVNIDTTVVIN